MAKDPAVLVYFDKWISSTNGISADFRSWYFDLLIYQYDKKGIPNDEDMIAGICRIKPSEYARFKQFLQQMLKQKFSKCQDGFLRNDTMQEVLEKRETFKTKKEFAGTIGQIIKMAKDIEGFDYQMINDLKQDLYLMTIEELKLLMNKQMLKQILKQTGKLYINVDEDINKVNKGGTGGKNPEPEKPRIPTLESVKNYFEINLPDMIELSELFFEHYSSTGWEANGFPIRDWKARARKWAIENRNKKFQLEANNQRKEKNKIAQSKKQEERYGSLADSTPERAERLRRERDEKQLQSQTT